MGNRYADHLTPLYPQKLALTSPTGGGRSVGIVRSRTKATEFSFLVLVLLKLRVHFKLIYYVCKQHNENVISFELSIKEVNASVSLLAPSLICQNQYYRK